ncbi:hypothetical protein [Geodermatophilus sp. SYSU D00815]
MSAALPSDDGTGGRPRPGAAGDLPAVLDAAPMFRRAVAGYDRFQVDTYVRWAEDELATADRERERLEARHLRAQAALEEARELLSHSPAGRDCRTASHRLAAVLAAAADQAEGMRADAEADRAAAAAAAQRVLADARAEADRLVADAAAAAAARAAEAARLVEAAEQERARAAAEAEVRLAGARAVEQRAAERAERLRRRAADDAAAARLQARQESVQLLATGREERRRADDAAAAARARLDRDAATRRAVLLAEIDLLERRRGELARTADPVPAAPRRSRPHPRGSLGRLRSLIASRVAP